MLIEAEDLTLLKSQFSLHHLDFLCGRFPVINLARTPYVFVFSLQSCALSIIRLYHYPKIQRNLHKPPGGYAPAAHIGGLCSIPVHSVWDLC